MRVLTKRELILLFALALLFLIYLFYTYLYTPLITNTEKILQENSELEAVTVLVTKLDEEESKEVLDKKRQEFEELNKKVPEDVYLPETIKELEEMSKKNEVQLVKTQYYFDKENDKDKDEETISYKECLLEIDMVGAYSNLTKFVKALEKAERLYTIDSIKMNLDQAGTNTGQEIIMTLVFKCYYDNISWDDVNGKDKIVYKNEKPSDPFAIKY
ncbi:MAG: type 4a pilus biogenesis protein PilO [Syntrophomonadaceae bacterium]|nr:type 4a pilus biogenesis protein PilO [Syntrophomonadaceae bacterium]